MADSSMIDTEEIAEYDDDCPWQKPTCIKQLAIGGAYLGEKEIKVPFQDVDGYTLLEMSKANRRMARAIGIRNLGHNISPFKNFDGFAFLKQRRDATIDELIMRYLLEGDETADKPPDFIPHDKRVGLFGDAKIPNVIDVVMPELRSTKRDFVLGSCVFRMKSTPRKSENVWVEFETADGDSTIIDWLKDARYVEIPIESERHWGDTGWGETEIEHALPELEYPYAYRKRNKAIMVIDKSKRIKMTAINMDAVTPDVVGGLVTGAIEALKTKSNDKGKQHEHDGSSSHPMECTPKTPCKVFPIFEFKSPAGK